MEKRDLLKDPAAPNDIPWEVLTDLGELRMGLVGLDGETVIKPTIWLTYGYVADGVDPESGEDPQPPTPSWEQQMVEQATIAANAAKAAKETADNLQASAEAGEFNGPEGPPGKSPIIQDGNWWLWDVEAQEYRDTGIAASGGGGGGVSSYNDLSDRPRIGGVLLEGDKTAQDLGLQPKGDYATTSSKLANPFSLTFDGAVDATYDGSQTVTVTIPTIAGPIGTTPDIQIGTVDTLEPDSDATATITGTPESPLLNLGIPRGRDGIGGTQGQEMEIASLVTDEPAAVISIDMAGKKPVSDFRRLIVTVKTPKNDKATSGLILRVEYTDLNRSLGIVANKVQTDQTYDNTSAVVMDFYELSDVFLAYCVKISTIYGVGIYSDKACGVVSSIDKPVNDSFWNAIKISGNNTNVYPSFPAGTKVRVAAI